MPFTAPLEIRKVGPEEWVVLKRFAYQRKGLTIIVPSGYKTDLASIPKAVRSFVSGRGYWDQPAVLHDHLVTHYVDVGRMAWKEAADHMLEAMRDMEELWNIPWYRQRKHVIHKAVKAWGLFR